jgi:hypothetical protein
MANITGNSGDVTISAAIVAEVLSFSLTEGVNVIDDTVIGDAADTHQVGTTNWSGSVSCFWDDTDATGQEAMTIGASVELHLRPEGAGAGNIDFNGTASITSIERAVANNAIVTANFSFQGTGALTRSVLI